MRPRPEVFCPVVPFDRDVSRMSDEDLRAYAAAIPSGDFPPVRWPGDGMDDLRYPDGTRFGPPPGDDLALLFGPGAAAWQSISNKTVMDMGSLLAAFQKRCLAEAGPDRRAWPPLVLMRCLVKGANVEGLTIGAHVRVLTCVFVEPARFSFARFSRGLDLLGSIFAREAHFTGTAVEERANFQAVAFLRGVHFHETAFECLARFDEAAFNGPLSLQGTRLREALDLARAFLQGAWWVDFSGLRVSGRTALMGDLRVRLEQIRGRILGEGGELLTDPERPAPDARARQEALAYAADQYSMLAGNFTAGTGPGLWRAADWCHSRYLDLWRQVEWLRGDRWGWLMGFLFKICLGNGIWLKYPLELALVVILGFGLVYAVGLPGDIRADSQVVLTGEGAAGVLERAGEGACSLADIQPAHVRVAAALYYSAMTFTTVGYGDWHPVGWARLFASVEALSGLTIISAFTVILVRKIIR